MKNPLRSFLIICATLTLGLGAPAIAQEDSGAQLAERASAAFAASDWSAAAALYAELVEARPDDATAWFRLATATLNSDGDPQSAAEWYERALDLGGPAQPTLWGLARARAAQRDGDAVLAALGRIAELGPSLGISLGLESRPDFDFLREDARFAELATAITPCTSEPYRHFDFWLGSWDVVSPQGQPLGQNTISSTLDGCMLLEEWEGATGAKGFSINYYDRETDAWNQIYRDNAGNVSGWPQLVGGLRDGAMVLEAQTDPDNLTRWTWTPMEDGRVRQMAESSSDGGETWQVGWDSYYVPVER